ncbi:hypothetical protein AALP_AA6G239700 [Arabis alpina]|uniref:Uncharacterized protein n=1 Tax=Arabis alpina TaxID=50452 RepID=A0A087GRB8_ARAAL|nr:hypothetical protein AALP_AA6G239700 [Arabis alpina]
MNKGKGKEVDHMGIDENVELGDDDLLLEDGELGIGDYEIEDPSGMITGSTSHGNEFLNVSEGEYGEAREAGDFDGETGEDGEYGTEEYYQKEREGGSPEATG